MNKPYITLEKEGRADYTVERSVFIGTARHIDSEEEAVGFIKRIRKEFSDAKHNVYAYTLSKTNVTRYSDDGEPQGTAGLPALDYIRKSGINDACVAVTRYFGGILLGKGGLVRAYTETAKKACEAAGIISLTEYTVFALDAEYRDLEKIRYELAFFGAVEDSAEYGNAVRLVFAVKSGVFEEVKKKLSEMSSGKCVIKVSGTRFDKI